MFKVPLLALLLATFLFPASQSLAHPGRTDANGCHTNRQTGEYHCHNSGSSGSSYTSPSYPSSSPAPSNPLNSPGNIIQLPSALRSSGQTVEIVSIGDGDTIRVRRSNQIITVRLGCIDAPELAQRPWGERAKYRLGQFLPVGQLVILREIDTDQYGRTVAEVFKNNRSINLQMVREGYAVNYPQFLGSCAASMNQYLEAETGAKQKRLAFWSEANLIMPWDFRR